MKRFSHVRSKFVFVVAVAVAFFSLGFAGSSAFAQPACSILTDGLGGTPVVYFGGWKSQESDGAVWAEGAQATAARNCGGRFKFEGHGLNGAGSSLASVKIKNAEAIVSCVQKIKAYSGTPKIKLLGHSDGSWVVNEIVNKLGPDERAKVQLVLLDGNKQMDWGTGGPPASVSCFTPSAANVSSCDEIQWPQHAAGDPPYTSNMMQGICSGHCKPQVLRDNKCPQNLWRAHFSLVSSNTNCALGIGDFNQQAYGANSDINLDSIGCDKAAPAGHSATGRSTR